MEVGIDITERKRAEAELAKHRHHLEELVTERTAQLAASHADLLAEKNRYRALFDQMTEGFALHEIICDGQGVPCDYRFLDINPAFERLTGLKRHEVAGRTLKEVLPGEDPAWIQRYGAVALTGEPIQFEHYARELKRHFGVLAYRPAPGQFAVIFTEVTERKLAEDALRESEGRLRLVAKTAKLGTYDADPVAGTLYLSPEFRAILGYPADAPAPPLGRVPGTSIRTMPSTCNRWSGNRMIPPAPAIWWTSIGSCGRTAACVGCRSEDRSTSPAKATSAVRSVPAA